MPQFYKYYKKNCKNPVSSVLFNKIITDYNKGIVNLIINESMDYTIPYLNFEITIRKYKKKLKIVNGKLINNVPPDWKATKELWAKDPEAKEKKLVIRLNNSHTSGYVFRIYLKKFKSTTKNKNVYKFLPNRDFKRNLSKRIKDTNKDNFDAFLLFKPKK